MTLKISVCGDLLRRIMISAVCCLVAVATLFAQPPAPKYRTFDQLDFAGKKATLKRIGSIVAFTFPNDSTGLTVTSLHARINSGVVAILDTGGFTAAAVTDKHKVINFTGGSVAAGGSVTIVMRLEKKAQGAQANFWWWDTNGVRAGSRRGPLQGSPTTLLFTTPNGGTVRDYLYKKIVHPAGGLIVGWPNPSTGGWIRYKTADRKYFPHTDSSRCFDFIVSGVGNKHAFIGELKNPHVKKHNNHLLGELHILKLAIIANDSGVTEPTDASTRLGDLIYNDGSNPGDPNNGKTIRQIVALTDSGLTYCSNFSDQFYFGMDSVVSRINRAFDGPYTALSEKPLLIAGVNTLPAWLQPNPAITPVIAHFPTGAGLIDDVPEKFVVEQNYPNPFNPTTQIDFNLPEPSIVTLTVYNLLGQEVATLLNKEAMDDGQQEVEFDAGNLTSGVYFYRVVAQTADGAQHYQAVKRMLLMK